MDLRVGRRCAFAVLLCLGFFPAHASGQARPQPRTARADVQPAAATSRAPSPTARERTNSEVAAPAAGAKATGPRVANAPGPLKPVGPQAPFVLTQPEQQLLDQILLKWEKESDKISTFKCSFVRWEYDKTYGPKHLEYLKSKAEGTIKYKAPDRGDYSVTDLDEWDANKNAMVRETTQLDHWICDGRAIFEFDRKNKQLIERKLPSEMQGKAIADGPLPFVFGAKADQLKKRYWMKDITPRDQIGKQVWLEAWPKRPQDAANFHHATLILTDPTFRPYALQIYLPNVSNNTAYMFTSTKANDPLAIIKGDFLPPMTPFGWTRVVDPEATAEANKNSQAPPAGDQPEAKRQTPPARRK